MESSITSTPLFGINMAGKFELKRDYDFNGKEHKLFSTYEVKFHDLFNFYKNLNVNELALKGNTRNISTYKECVTDASREDFAGGTYESMTEPHTEFAGYEENKKKISSSKVWKEIKTKFDQASVRKRVKSEYDGEFDHDKRYDIQPFQRRENRKGMARIVKMFVDSSFCSDVSASDINRYGSFVAAIINTIESNGIQVEIWACYSGTNHAMAISPDDDFDGCAYRFKMLVKKSDEYLPIGSILKIFSSNWYRRAKFGLIISSAEHMNGLVRSGLGEPYDFGKCFEIKDQCLHIYSLPSQSDQDQIMIDLMKAVGNDPAKEQTTKPTEIEVPF